MLEEWEFWFDGERLAFVEIDSDLDLLINFSINQKLLLGASKMLGDWMQEVYENRENILNDYVESSGALSNLGKEEIKIVKDLKTGKHYEFIEYVQQRVDGCTFISNTPHAKVKELDSKAEKYIPVNQIEFK